MLNYYVVLDTRTNKFIGIDRDTGYPSSCDIPGALIWNSQEQANQFIKNNKESITKYWEVNKINVTIERT